MKSARRLLTAASLALGLPTLVFGGDDSFRAPDSLVLKDGRVIRGLIIKNSRDTVLIQERHGEYSYPKSEIVRIRDEADVGVEFTDLHRKGNLPAWRVIANDLRSHDAIKSLAEIPATLIDNGQFKNVPYKSFRVNRDIELNIYGDPENPAGIELGIFGPKSGNERLRQTLRGYLAGYLTTRAEVAALYSLGLESGIKDAGHLTMEITPRDAPDAYGAWWVSIYNKKALSAVRLSDREYARLVRPVNEILDQRGRVIGRGWSKEEISLSERLKNPGSSAKVLLRGFYRDKNGDFHLITDKAP